MSRNVGDLTDWAPASPANLPAAAGAVTDPLWGEPAAAAGLLLPAEPSTRRPGRRATNPETWRAWLADPAIASRYRAKIWIPRSRDASRDAHASPDARIARHGPNPSRDKRDAQRDSSRDERKSKRDPTRVESRDESRDTHRVNRAHDERDAIRDTSRDAIASHRIASGLDDPTYDHQVCWPWIGAVSDTGHGSFRVASAESTGGLGTIPAHLFGYQLAYGPLPRRGVDQTRDLIVIRHTCDEHGCQNWDHWIPGDPADNSADYRRRRMYGPLADRRGPAGRTRAIADAVRAGLAAGEDDAAILLRVEAARRAGEPETLF